MDEILASIRRIIESGDEREGTDNGALLSISADADGAGWPQGLDQPAAAASPVPPFDVHYLPKAADEEPAVTRHRPDDDASVASERAAVEIQADGSRDDGLAPSATAAVDPVPAPAPSGDAIADDAWWDAAIADANPADADAHRHAPAAAEALVAGAEIPPPDNENTAATDGLELLHAGGQDARHPGSAAIEAAIVPPGDAPQAPAYRSEEPTSSASPTTARPAEPVRAEIPESVLTGASALLSAQAGDQVAAAFDDLTRAIREGQMRSMEGMAREIMRPMLQEWLDDNLPRIVERLVREEIERIARGPRR